MEKSDLRISVNRRRAPFTLLVSLLVTIFVFVRLLSLVQENGLESTLIIPSYLSLLIPALYVFFLSGVDYSRRLFDKNAFLTVNTRELINHLGVLSAGRVNWREVSTVVVDQTYTTPLLLIRLRDPRAFARRQAWWKRPALILLIRRWGTPIVIPEKRVDRDLHTVKDILMERLISSRSGIGEEFR